MADWAELSFFFVFFPFSRDFELERTTQKVAGKAPSKMAADKQAYKCSEASERQLADIAKRP